MQNDSCLKIGGLYQATIMYGLVSIFKNNFVNLVSNLDIRGPEPKQLDPDMLINVMLAFEKRSNEFISSVN